MITGGVVAAVTATADVLFVCVFLGSMHGWSHAVSRPWPLSASVFCCFVAVLAGFAAVVSPVVVACFGLLVLPIGRPALRLLGFGSSVLRTNGSAASSGCGGGRGGSAMCIAPSLCLVWG